MRKLTERTLTALLIAALAGLVSLVSPPDLISSTGGQSVGEGRGDNPVVGSLPCRVDDDLDLKFFNWLGGSRPAGMISYNKPTLAYAGDTNLGTHVLDAQGTPMGMVNAATGWSCMGSVLQMQVTTTRVSAGKQYRLVMWVPDDYIGGTATLSSSIGGSSWTVGGNTFLLPVGALASAPGIVESGVVTMTSLDGANVCTVHIDVIANVVVVDFQP